MNKLHNIMDLKSRPNENLKSLAHRVVKRILSDLNDDNIIIDGAEFGEILALDVCEKHFGKKFTKLGGSNEGFDVKSIDGEIIVEVKTVGSTNGSSNQYLISSFKNKIGKCTHFLLFDLFSEKQRASIMTHDEFFSEFKFARADKSAVTWNATYKDGRNMNHRVFINHEIEL